MNIASSILVTFLTLAALLQGMVAFKDLRNNSGHPKIWIVSTTICIALAIISGYASYASASKSDSPSSTPTPIAPATHAPGSQSSSTATSASPTTSNVNSTALVPDGTIPENKLLTCSMCSGGNDPIHFTINSITIDNGRTVWSATLNNISGSTYDVTNSGITLQVTSGVTSAVSATGYSSTYMNPGDEASIHFNFAFPPYKGVQYTFSAHLNTSDASTNMPFDPVNFTFLTGTSTSPITTNITPTALATDRTITENRLLTCSTCSGGNDPIHFTIDSITIDNANGRTVWSATLHNISGSTYDVTNWGIALQESSGITPAVRSTGYSSTYMNAGDKATIHFNFAFVPHKGVQYTFSARLNTSDASTNMPFDPVNFTF